MSLVAVTITIIDIVGVVSVFGNWCCVLNSSHLRVGAFLFFVGTRVCDGLCCFSCDV